VTKTVYFWLRLIRDYNVPEAAEKLRISEQYVRAIENGKRKPSARLKKDFSKLYNVDETIIEQFYAEKPVATDKFLLRLLNCIVS
jgi:transcriptional regulator with XRE-family HTH domain